MSKKSFKIVTPIGSVSQMRTDAGKLSVRLDWNDGFARRTGKNFEVAQKFVDSEFLRLSSGYVPFQTGMLEKSGILGTEIGSGEVDWIAPYARKQYYTTAETRSYDVQRGGMWGERTKIDHKDEILKGARKKAGGK